MINIIDALVMDGEKELAVVEDAERQVAELTNRFIAQSLRFVLSGKTENIEMGGGIIAAYLIELDAATAACVDLLQKWNVSDSQLTQLRAMGDALFEERFRS